YPELLAEHRSLVRRACGRHGGVEVDTQGDALFFAFPSAVGAVAAAGEAQAVLRSTPARPRIGLHTGQAEVTAEGYVGLAVHLAAQLAERHLDGVWWVDLTEAQDAADVRGAIARSLGVSSDLAGGIASRQMRVVLDNFEHVLPAAPEVAALLDACPRLE